MASPAAAKSRWVTDEIEWWKANRSADRILIALTDGDIKWSGRDFDWDVTDAIPRSLSGAFVEEPLWMDLRKLRASEPNAAMAKERPRLGTIVAEFAAPIHGREKDELVGEHLRQRKETRRLLAAVIASLSVLLLIASGATVLAFNQR
jgi:hypothetical protein